jgi:hypothetical protein
MVRMKLIPVAMGIINEKLSVESALNKASAENRMRAKALRKGILKTNEIHSLILVKAFPLNCPLIKAAPETLKAAYRKM